MNLIALALLSGSTASVEAVEPAYVPPAEPAFVEALLSATADEEGGSPFSYTFLELGVVQFDVDAADDEVDIYYLDASLALGMFQLVASYENSDLSFMDTSADTLSIGAGLHFNLSPKLDIEGDIRWIYSDVNSDLSNIDGDDNGYMIRAGPRWMPLDWDRGGLELNGQVLYVDLANRLASEEEAWGWGVEARAHFLKLFSVGLGYDQLEDDDRVQGNVRVSL